MRCRIHRGAHEVGGNCVEVEHDEARVVLDLGWPLAVDHNADVPLPGVPGLVDDDRAGLLGVIISHAHFDHYGLLSKVQGRVPVYMGEAARRILREAAFFTDMGIDIETAGFLVRGQTFRLGPFSITPYLNDHSAFDAYSLLVEAGGRRMFYTGDLRAHGRKAGLFEAMVREPPPDVDVVLMEGTHIKKGGEVPEPGPTESDVESACVDTFKATTGMVLAMYSPQNIDRLVTMYRACLRSGRDFVIDLYTAAIVVATGQPTIPQPDWERVRVFLPQAQRSKVIKAQAFERTDAVKARRIYPEELAERAGELVMLFRDSMASELEAAGCLEGAHVVWSMWPGYLRKPSGDRLRAFLDRHAVPMTIHHASGHAYVADLQRLVAAIAPGRVVPIHSEAGDRFGEFFPRVEHRHDGEWWDV